MNNHEDIIQEIENEKALLQSLHDQKVDLESQMNSLSDEITKHKKRLERLNQGLNGQLDLFEINGVEV